MMNLDEIAGVGGEPPILPVDKKQRYAEFWRPLLKELNDRGEANIKVFEKTDSYYDGPGSGFGGISRRMRFTRENEARVEIWIRSPDKDWNKRVFDLLKESRENIEADLGAKLVWERDDHNIRSCLGVSRGGAIEDSQEYLDEIRRWMLDWVIKFRPAFRPYLEEVLNKTPR